MIRVLVVDDSALVRKIFTDELSKFNDIEVIGSALDPYIARDKILKLQPDVLTLDLEMPRMDGLTFLSKVMKHHPLPVVVVSSLTPKNSEAALKALSLGAIEVICKPSSQYSTPSIIGVAQAIRAAASARILKPQDPPASDVKSALTSLTPFKITHQILAIGASTGGPQAVESVIKALPANVPGTVIVQHMPENFTASFAARLNKVSQMEVREARDNDCVVPGVALIAPGNKHLLLQRSGPTYLAKVKDGPLVHHQRPAVDVLFQTVAQHAGRNAVGVILTGMGADGAKGLLSMRENGAYTLAQDQSSCVVYGMPKEAVRMGAANEVVPLSRMPQAILKALERSGR